MVEKRDSMSFILGAVVGGLATYYAYTHKDEIIDKVQKIEDKLNHNETIGSLKEQLETLTNKVQSVFHHFSSSKDAASEHDIDAMTKEIADLKAQLQALKS